MGDGKQPESIGFNQASWEVHGNVYNVNGDLILNENSSKDDFSKVLTDLSAELSKLQNLPTDIEHKIADSLKAATQTVATPAPEKDKIVERLNAVKETLSSVKNSVEGARELAKTIAKVAAWVTTFLI